MPFGRGSSKKKSKKKNAKKGGDRDKDFMAEPEGGWLHDKQALGFGAGIYYSFPVKYVGSIQVLDSLRRLNGQDKTKVCREAINRCAEGVKRFKAKRKQIPVYQQYLADVPFLKEMDLKLNISAKGIATTHIQTQEILANDAIGKISFAAGGNDKAYSWVTYVAKDKRNNRYCHVFDCGATADDVLATLGQVFTMIKEGDVGKPRGAAPPPLPTNHPTMLAGAAALQAAPKMAAPVAQEVLKYDDGDATYGEIDEPAAGTSGYGTGQYGDSTYGDDEYLNVEDDKQPTGSINPLMAKPALPPPRNAPLENYEDMEELPQYGDMEPVENPAGADMGPQTSYTPMGMPNANDNQNLGAIDLYEQLEGPVDATESGQRLVEFLNTQVKSRNIYGDDEPEDGLYGDGDVGWNYLSVKPEEEDTYGTLADFAAQ